MPSRRRHSTRQPQQAQQPRGSTPQQHQVQGQLFWEEQRQDHGQFSQNSSDDTRSMFSAAGLPGEVQRRLRLCNANVLDVGFARMQGGDFERRPTLIRISAFQKISERKRWLLLSWTPTSQQAPTGVPIETPPTLEFISHSGRYVAQLTARLEEDKATSGTAEAPPAQRLEVWGAEGSGCIGCFFCLHAPHGVAWSPPYGRGSFCVNDENLFAYTAEVASPESKGPLDGFLYKDIWGEQLLNHSKGRVFVGRLSPSVLTHIEPRDVEASYCQASFIPDGSAVVCTELPAGPYRLGLKFCVNRRSSVVLAWLSREGLSRGLVGRGALSGGDQAAIRPTWLSISGDEDWAAWSPRICEASGSEGPLLRFEVVYLALSKDPQEIRPHFGNVRLRIATIVRATSAACWGIESRRTILAPSAPWDPRRRLETCEVPNGSKGPAMLHSCCVSGPLRNTQGTSEELKRSFQGLCTMDLPPWRSHGFILANTMIGCRPRIISICLNGAAEGPIVREVQLEKPLGPSVPADIKAAAAAAAVGEMSLRDTRGPWMLIQTSSPVHVPILVLAKLKETPFSEGSNAKGDLVGPPLMAEIVDALCLRGPQSAFDGAVKKLHLHLLTLSLYILDCQRHWLLRLARPPKGPEIAKLAVMVHGGPHSCSSCAYNRDVLFLTTLGFDVLVVNYRGSTGFGQDELVSIHGRAGRQDVDDVAGIVKQAVEHFDYDPRRCVAVGGSHGGFLCCHLIGQFPKLFRAVSMRNPVTYVPAMYAASDIPDFVFPESCEETFAFSKTPSKDSLLKMQHLSPTEYVGSVEASVLLGIGAKDLRVPPSQGLLFWKLLNAHGKKCRLLWYPNDNHSIDRPAGDADYWVNTGAWFLDHVPGDVLPPL
ncbi:hypothetical protein Esti_003182 [Eimeria stiedai]